MMATETGNTTKTMRGLFERSGIEVSDRDLERFALFYRELEARSKALDLTRLEGMEDIVIKHFIDSLLPGELTELPSPLLDIGSGAGFPGIPLAMRHPDLELVLAESRKKRVSFLLSMIDLLGLKNVRVYPHKVHRDFPLEVNGVITRALEGAGDTLARSAPFLPPGGRVILMKGPAGTEEIDGALSEMGRFFDLTEDVPYTIEGTDYQRRLIVFTRTNTEYARDDDGGRHADRSGKVVDIQSPANDRYKMFVKLLDGRGVKKEGMTILSGKKAVEEAAAQFPELLRGWITRGGGDPPPREAEEVPWYRLSGALFREIDVHGTGPPLALMAVPDIPEWTDEPKETWPAGLTLFIPFQDPANVGAAVRSAAAFGAVRVVLLSGGANPYHHKSVRAAGTALFRVPLFRGPPLEELEVTGAPLYSLSPEGEGLEKAVLPRTLGLLAGLEGPGLPRRFREKRVLSIPMEKGVESLNAAAAVTVALFEWHRRHRAKGDGGG